VPLTRVAPPGVTELGDADTCGVVASAAADAVNMTRSSALSPMASHAAGRRGRGNREPSMARAVGIGSSTAKRLVAHDDPIRTRGEVPRWLDGGHAIAETHIDL